ncbi:PKD domain-containing protein [Chryseobacterium sp. ERMR1:04]|uniref:PKD domain-containing protein n=1 Tax=Chryseobacterium sp. ERMR1:04 TaxID=1705393 RepID=UPI0006C8932E|nr:PKD domain-containing protein [Chryseobacterium sp. ERMR1:04]
MKNNTYFGRQYVFRLLLLIWLIVPWVLQAQSLTHITWDSQVGCKEYRGDKEDGNSSESIDTSQCVRVCGGSTVKYTATGPNISSVQWSVSGGTLGNLVIGGANTQPEITWDATAGSGSIQAVITYTNGTVETQTICIEKINSPSAKFEILNMDDTVCKNTIIHFSNLSHQNGGTDIVNYFWEFGDGTTSTAFEPSHAYTDEGPHTVRLTVTNKCGCSNFVEREFRVIRATPVQINCASVVCEGSTETYSVEDGCNGEWKVIGGTIVGHNGNTIEVKWDHVDPTDGFGYVMYKSECGCPEWTTIKIPVILAHAKIKGESVVCANKQYKYTLPQWPTTNFQWNVSGPSGAQLNYNQQRNEVLFSASQPGTYTLTSNYNNTLLLCKGDASITIVVEEPVVISGGAEEICVGTSQTFTATPNVPVIWKISTGSSVYTSPPTTGPFNYTFPTAGSYTVIATKQGGGCESNTRLIKVISIPRRPAAPILGDIKVCPGKPYTYTISFVESGMLPVWEVTNGTIQGSNTGTSVTVIFNSGATSYTVSVRTRLASSTVSCLSPPNTLTINPIDLNSITINPNPGPFCPSSTQSFSANLNGIVPDVMEWRFESPNFGSFANGQGTGNIVVNFNEISSTDHTNLILKITKCGIVKEISIPVSLLTLPTVSFANTANICLGSDLSFSVNQGTITSATSVIFTFANGTTYPATFNALGNYTFPNSGYIQNNSGANISQQVTVEFVGTNGCNYRPKAVANFIVYPETIITVSPVYNIIVCDPSTFSPYTLMANSSTGLTNIVSWQWSHNDIPISGAITNSFTILPGAGIFGTYKVKAKDVNGCTVYSQDIKVTQDCPLSNCNANPQISFIPKWTDCNTITASNLTYSGTPDEIQWVSNSVLNLVSPQGATNATFQTTLAGAHIVFVRLRYGTCWYSQGIEVQKNYEPKFNVSQVCNGNGYNVTLHNTSTIFNINGSSISYSFSGGGQPTQNGQTATYNNLAPGTYTFTMTISAPGKPVCTTTQTITLAPIPNLDFLIPAWICVGDVVTFSPIGYSPLNKYTWYFDGTSYVAPGANAQITYNTGGFKSIQLEVTTPNGCTYTSLPISINVNVANFTGFLSPLNSTECVGNNPNIIYNNTSFTSPTGYIWMNGSQPVVGAPNSISFTPTQSGSYWPVLVSSLGCKSYVMSQNPAIVTLKTVPYVNISAKANICTGQSVVLSGIVTDNTLQYQWKKNGALVSLPWASSPYPIVLNTGSLSTGTYVYTLEVRTPGTSGCIGSKNFTVTVSNPPAAPSITYTKESCQPYAIKLTASGPSNGDYNWSNGMSGQSITVNEGGAYQVIYTAPSGCTSSSQVQVPLSIESLIWVFPTGCYDECTREGRSILGPKGIFNHHDWQLFGNNIQSGNNSLINPLFINTPGSYQLYIEHFGCQYTAGTMNFFPGKECGIETQCKLEAKIDPMKWDKDHYNVYGSIYNGATSPITLTVSSLNGYGSYIPSIITIPAGGTYDMSANPLAFYPNNSFPGGADEILFQTQDCKIVVKVEVPNFENKLAISKSESTASLSSLKIAPNPAKEKVRISYNTGSEKLQAKQITIFDARGNIKFRKELKASSGEVDVEVSSWLQSVYIVIVQTGDTSLQGKLIKN